MQIPGVLDDLYAAQGRQARARARRGTKGVPSLALWAPTAQNVDLLVWPAARPSRPAVAAERQTDGSWTVDGKKSWAGAQYLWEVTVYAPTTDKVEVNQVTDPYSVALTAQLDALGAGRPRRQGVPADASGRRRSSRWCGPWTRRSTSCTCGTSRSTTRRSRPPSAARTSRSPATAPVAQHLRELEKAGLTTVHLLPTFDIASIEEDRALQTTPDCDLASYAPDSDQQQACVTARAPTRTASTGATTRCTGRRPRARTRCTRTAARRVAEFRTMVGALHADGLQVVLDQVFNHTTASGQAPQSVLDRVVPGYYQRLNATGQRRDVDLLPERRDRARHGAASSWSTRWSRGPATTRSTASGSTSWATTRWTT